MVTEIKMVRSGIVKIHCALHETQTENPDIKVEVPLRIAGDRSDVMESWDFVIHQGDGNVRSNSCRKVPVESGQGVRSKRALVVRLAFVLKGQL